MSTGRGIQQGVSGAQVAEELAVLPEGSAIIEMMSDYAMMREQARACF
jgi:hypothetical protein